MHLSFLDQLSNNGNSFFHTAAPLAKVVMTTLFLTSLMISREIYQLLPIVFLLTLCFFIARLPFLKIVHICFIPAFFSTLFALFEMQQSIVSGIMIILRGVGAALTMLFLMSTTSYAEVFGFLGLFIPKQLLDLLFFTYRSFFILLDRVANLVKSIRLRGGFNTFGIVSNVRSLSGMAAVLLLHSFEMGERMYRIYSLRGYDGSLPVKFRWKHLKSSDYMVMLFSLLILLGVLLV